MRVLVTGANGFVGKHLVGALSSLDGFKLSATARRELSLPSHVKFYRQEFSKTTDWTQCLKEQDVIIHTAAMVKQIARSGDQSAAYFREVNVEGTINLANQASLLGVKRLIFISSIKVNGETTQPGQAFQPHDLPAPKDGYAVSKLAAEELLIEVSRRTNLEVVIIRCPLIYGAGVKGNLATLIKLVMSGVPLPFLSIKNKRSILGDDNLVDLLITCTHHPNASNEIFLASDGHDQSTAEIVRNIEQSLSRPSRLCRCPPGLLIFLASILGKQIAATKLTESLQVDISKTKQLLDWVHHSTYKLV